MLYQDLVYGSLEIPAEIWKLFADPLLVRLRGISQAVLPVDSNPFCTAVSRFHHGIGVWWLAKRLCRQPEFRHLDPILPLAGLLHDAGNPPFSHTGDWFMRETIGCDGETNLRRILPDTDLARALQDLGASPGIICDFVAGKLKPWSDLLNGTLDLDNLDNVIRFARAQGLDGVCDYDPCRIVDAFRLSPAGEAIELDAGAEWEVRKWKKARQAVYGNVYGEPHLGLAMMLHRAIEIAHTKRELVGSFWHLTDRAALEYLANCNAGTRMLIDAVRRLQPYCLAASWEGNEEPFECEWTGWRIRQVVADELAETAGIEPWEAIAYLGVGKYSRKITIPFRSGDDLWHDRDDVSPTYRIRLYLSRLPGGLAKVVLEDVLRFSRQAIQSRLPLIKPIKPAAGRAGF